MKAILIIISLAINPDGSTRETTTRILMPSIQECEEVRADLFKLAINPSYIKAECRHNN